MSKQIGLLLVREKMISRDQLSEAEGSATSRGKNLLSMLMDQGVVDEGALAVFVSEKLNIPLADRATFENIPPTIIKSVARDLVDEFSLIPIGMEKNAIKVAMIDPTDHAAIEELKFFLKKSVFPMVASRQIVHSALKRYYDLSRPQMTPAKLTKAPDRAAPATPILEISGNIIAERPAVTRLSPPAPKPVPSPTKPSAAASSTTNSLSAREPIALRRPPATFQVPASVNPVVSSAPMPLVEFHKSTLSLLDQATTKEKIAGYFLDFASKILKRVALFTIKKNVLLGWEGRGADFQQRNLKGIMIPLNSPSLFQRVRDTKVYYLGEVPDAAVNQIFLTALGGQQPPNVLLIPMTIQEKVFCIFYGDHETENVPSGELHFLHLLIPKVESAFEGLILNLKKSS